MTASHPIEPIPAGIANGRNGGNSTSSINKAIEGIVGLLRDIRGVAFRTRFGDEDHLHPQGKCQGKGPVWRGLKRGSMRREPLPGGVPPALGSRSSREPIERGSMPPARLRSNAKPPSTI